MALLASANLKKRAKKKGQHYKVFLQSYKQDKS